MGPLTPSQGVDQGVTRVVEQGAIIRCVSGARDESGAYGWFARLFRRLFHTPEDPDRGFYRAVGVMFAVGLFSLAVGMWAVLDPVAPVLTRPWLRLGAGILIGPMFMAFAVGALLRRWRQGPQAPGRHTQD